MQNSFKSKLLPILSVVLMTFFWGYNWVVMKQAVQLVGPWEFAFVRNFFGAVVLLLCLVVMQKSLKIINFKFVFLIGIFQMIGFTVLVLVALVHGGTAKISVLTFTMPIWANLLALYFLKEKMSNKQIFAIAISVIGLLLIFDPTHKNADFKSMLIAISAGFFWGCGVISVKKYNQKYPQVDLLNLTAWQMLLGSIPILFIIVAKGLAIYEINPYLWKASLYNIIFCNALAWLLWNYGVKHLKTSDVSTISLLAPVIGSLAAFVELHEAPKINEGIGLTMILCGVLMMILLASRGGSK
ncbi:MAG: DMT family transporter [Methylophilaceae bacterium]